MKFCKRSPLWWALLICGMAASVILLAGRYSAERQDRNVSAAMSWDDVSVLAAEEGISESEWLKALSGSGLHHIIFIGEPSAEQQAAAAGCGMEWGRFSFESGSEPVALIENLSRTDMERPGGLDVESYDGTMVKTLYLYDSYADRYTESEGGAEIENLLFRAALDRGLRLLILTPFKTSDGRVISEAGEYAAVLENLKARLAKRGLTLGDEFSCMDAPKTRPMLLAAAGLLTAMLWIALIMCLPVPKQTENILCILSAAVLFGGFYLMPALAQKGTMFLCAAAFPTAAVRGIERAAEKCEKLSVWKACAVMLIWSLCGGLAVAALMSGRQLMLGCGVFTGVKAAQALPLVICFVLLAKPAWRELRSAGGKGRTVFLCVCAAAAVAVGGYVLLSRSGDTAGGISKFETSFRNALEAFFFARPRTKEVLFAVPCIALFVLCAKRGKRVLSLLFGVGSCLECVSVVNTFCHAVAPLNVSLLRSVLAVACAVPVTAAAYGVLWLLLKAADGRGCRGMRH